MKGQIEYQPSEPCFSDWGGRKPWKPGRNSIEALLDHVINLSKILLRKESFENETLSHI